MPELTARERDRKVLLRAERAVLLARDELVRRNDSPVAASDACDIVDRVVNTLAALAADEEHDELRRMLLRWRDHLSSHVFAARALLDIEVDDDLPVHMLERGLAEVVGS